MKMNIGGRGWIEVDGYGRLSSGLAKQLIYAGHGVYPFELRDMKDRSGWYLRAQGLDFSHVTLQLAPPNEYHHLPGRSVSYTMHESTSLPPGWANAINGKSELLITPSPWLIPVFEDAGVTVPIEIVPGGIDPAECPIMGQNRQQPYRFICLADRGFRKGFDIVQTAFYKIFDARNRDVQLIIKCRPGSLPRLHNSYSTDDRLIIWQADVDKVADVFSQADACINPNRCEGLGMWPREAAACGVPTLVTRWSGTADDTDQWAIPIDNYKLVDSGMEGCGGQWAEPSLDEVCEKMLWLYENQDEAKARALKSAQWLRDNYTYAHAANKLVDVLGKHLGAPRPKAPPIEPETVVRQRNEQVMLSFSKSALRPNGHGVKADNV